MIAPIIAVSGKEEEGAKTWRDLGFRETYRLWKEKTVRQPDGSYMVDSLSTPDLRHFVPFYFSSCDCHHFTYRGQTCIHIMLAVKRDLDHRKEDAKKAEVARAKAQKNERIRFTPEQIEANLARMGGPFCSGEEVSLEPEVSRARMGGVAQ